MPRLASRLDWQLSSPSAAAPRRSAPFAPVEEWKAPRLRLHLRRWLVPARQGCNAKGLSNIFVAPRQSRVRIGAAEQASAPLAGDRHLTAAGERRREPQ